VALFLKAYSSGNTAVFIEDSGIAGDSVETVTFDDEWDVGYRVEIGYMPQAGLGWAARYWHFDTEHTARSEVDGTTAFFTDDPDIQIDDGDSISAIREFDLDVGDIAATFVTRSGNTAVKYSAGIRILDSEMTGFWENLDDTSVNVSIINEFDGAGPLLGVDLIHPLFQNSTTFVNIYAGGSVAMLYGDGDLSLHKRGGEQNVLIVDRDDGFVYNGEVRFGLEAVFRQSPKSLIEYFATAGLEGQYWANIGTVASGISHDGDADYLLEGDLGLLGGTLTFGVRGEF